MFLNYKFNYPSLQRVTHASGERYYVCPLTGSPLTSVTTILSATDENKEALANWRKFVGDAKADRVITEARNKGSLMHEDLELFVQGKPRSTGTNLIHKMARNMANGIINDCLCDVDEVWGLEVPLYYPQLYAGTTDLVGVYKGKDAIMDYKTTKKMKTKSQITNYFCQGVAYAIAHNLHFETNISTVAIFMVDSNNFATTFEITGSEFEHYAEIFLKKLNQFGVLVD